MRETVIWEDKSTGLKRVKIIPDYKLLVERGLNNKNSENCDTCRNEECKYTGYKPLVCGKEGKLFNWCEDYEAGI